MELEDRKLRIEDAKNAAFAAMDEGIALLAPSKVIATNAGVDGEVVVEKTRKLNW
ncbi:hypothetical protein Gohar_004149, partial [Gossypium harknessii]|nr:hypothetical protein [Gossypium harknessii]